ncbi:MAG: Cyanophycin synthetase [candidate division WS6 bacterium OLB20]|uniref:Cyanophycin synthetase n=1 Tax=candidate division WS6 bacterium OLB20 TaxID=1617426 RepID=A0A136LYD7_9BACT|nr:MAG: Cyanophycin synthetase [candidate division WS6 bacterium OLB20]
MAANIHLQQYLNAADRLPLSYSKLDSGTAEFRYRTHRFLIIGADTPINDSSSATITRYKHRSQRILAEKGLTVPRFEKCSTEKEFVNRLKQFDCDIVVKPTDGIGGKGVSIKPQSPEDKREAFRIAKAESKTGRVLIEQYIEGSHYRILILDGKMIAAARRYPASVTGNGSDTIDSLINSYNLACKHDSSRAPIRVDSEVANCLREQNIAITDIPAAGVRIELRRNCNLSTGGTTAECTDSVPEVAIREAIAAAGSLCLRFAGVDIIYTPGGEAFINEVNCNPGMRIHYYPSSGRTIDVARYVLQAILDEYDRMDLQLLAAPKTALDHVEVLEGLTDTVNDSL